MSRQVCPHREFSSEDIIQIAEECIKSREQNPDAAWLGIPEGSYGSEDVIITDRSGTFVLTHQLYPYTCTPLLGNNNDPMANLVGLLFKQSNGDNTLAGKLTKANNRALTLINDELRRLYPNSPSFINFESETVEHHFGNSLTKVYHMQEDVVTTVPLTDLKDWLHPGSLVASKNRYRMHGIRMCSAPYIRSVILEMMVRRAKYPSKKTAELNGMKEAFAHFDQSNLE